MKRRAEDAAAAGTPPRAGGASTSTAWAAPVTAPRGAPAARVDVLAVIASSDGAAYRWQLSTHDDPTVVGVEGRTQLRVAGVASQRPDEYAAARRAGALARSQFISALHKTVRRRLVGPALAAAAEMWRWDPLEALSATIVTAVEDAALHPALPALACLASAASPHKRFQARGADGRLHATPPLLPPPSVARLVLSVVADLCACPWRDVECVPPYKVGEPVRDKAVQPVAAATLHSSAGVPHDEARPPTPAEMDALAARSRPAAALVFSLVASAGLDTAKGEFNTALLTRAARVWARRLASPADGNTWLRAVWAVHGHAPPAPGFDVYVLRPSAPGFPALTLAGVPRLAVADVPPVVFDHLSSGVHHEVRAHFPEAVAAYCAVAVRGYAGVAAAAAAAAARGGGGDGSGRGRDAHADASSRRSSGDDDDDDDISPNAAATIGAASAASDAGLDAAVAQAVQDGLWEYRSSLNVRPGLDAASVLRMGRTAATAAQLAAATTAAAASSSSSSSAAVVASPLPTLLAGGAASFPQAPPQLPKLSDGDLRGRAWEAHMAGPVDELALACLARSRLPLTAEDADERPRAEAEAAAAAARARGGGYRGRGGGRGRGGWRGGGGGGGGGAGGGWRRGRGWGGSSSSGSGRRRY
jgi:hypothetical protein